MSRWDDCSKITESDLKRGKANFDRAIKHIPKLSTEEQQREMEKHLRENLAFQISDFTSKCYTNFNNSLWDLSVARERKKGNPPKDEDGNIIVYVKESDRMEREFDSLTSSILEILSSDFSFNTVNAFIDVMKERIELDRKCNLHIASVSNIALLDEIRRVRELPSYENLKQAIKNDSCITLDLDFIYNHIDNFRDRRSLHLSPLSIALIDVYYNLYDNDDEFIDDVKNFALREVAQRKNNVSKMSLFPNEVLDIESQTRKNQKLTSDYNERVSIGKERLEDKVYSSLLKLQKELGIPDEGLNLETRLFTDIGYVSFDFTVQNINNPDHYLDEVPIHGIIEVDGEWHYLPGFRKHGRSDPAAHISNVFDWISNKIRNDLKRESLDRTQIPYLVITLRNLEDNNIEFACRDFLENMKKYENKHYYACQNFEALYYNKNDEI